MSPVSPPSGTPKADAQDHALTADLTRIILTNNVEFIRGTMQTLQALAAALVTASAAGTVALSTVSRYQDVSILVAILPTLCFAGALASLVLSGFARRYKPFGFGDPTGTLNAYEESLARRRHELFLPGALIVAGLILGVLILAGGRSSRQSGVVLHETAVATVLQGELDLYAALPAVDLRYSQASARRRATRDLETASQGLRQGLAKLSAVDATKRPRANPSRLVRLLSAQMIQVGRLTSDVEHREALRAALLAVRREGKNIVAAAAAELAK